MTDPEEVSLRAALLESAARIGGIESLPEERLEAVVGLVVARFVADAGASWWWERPRDDLSTRTVEYGDRDPWERIPQLVPERSAYVLLVTNEAPWPLGAFRGAADRLAELVADASYFEYALTDDEASFVVFDTHHNTLIAVDTNDGENVLWSDAEVESVTFDYDGAKLTLIESTGACCAWSRTGSPRSGDDHHDPRNP